MNQAKLLFAVHALLASVAAGDVAPGRYLILHRQTGRYLFGNGTLGSLGYSVTPLWHVQRGSPVDAGGDPAAVAAYARYSVLDVASGESLERVASLRESVDQNHMPAPPQGTVRWRLYRVCRGSSVVIVDGNGRVLVADSRTNLVSTGTREEEPQSLWVLIKACPHEDGGNNPSWKHECFPQGTPWASGAETCCDTKLHGSRGDQSCFDDVFSFERCCPEEARELELVQDSVLGQPSSLAPRILCSGERLEGEERSVKVADFDGERHWYKAKTLFTMTKLDFGGQSLNTPRALRLVDGLPLCGGPQLFETAQTILPSTEMHMIDIFQSLHEALMYLVQNSHTAMPDLAHDVFYLPFFPFLLITLHRLTRDKSYLQCISHTAAALGQLESWRRNAGYDFVLALGYDRIWERRAAPGLPEDAYHLQSYDPRFVNVLTLATHDAFFGDRHVLFHTNHGGTLYRNLRHIIVPLPFELNCTSWRRAVARRKRRAPRFAASFVGSNNGASRTVIRNAAERLSQQLGERAETYLAVRFVLNDEERAKLSQNPEATLRNWFGPDVSSFDQLLQHSVNCLVLPGDVSDLAMRFFHALTVGCIPVIVAGATQTIPLPFARFIQYSRFARFATIHTEADAVSLLRSLIDEQKSGWQRPLGDTTEAEPVQDNDFVNAEVFGGLFMRHVDCGFQSGEPFRSMLARELQDRARIWDHIRWYN